MLHFEVPDMYVKVYQNNFSGKQKSLFDALETAEKECGKDIKSKTPKSKRKFTSVVRRSQVKSFKGKESIFKVPEEPPPRMRFKNIVSAAQNAANRSPKRGRWTKYSLKNVDDMSDRSNARAAFSFLQELEDRRDGGSRDGRGGDVSLDQFKPIFQKREAQNKNIKTNFQSTKRTSSVSEGSSISSHKVCNRNGTEEIARRRIKLNHLDSEETEEE